MKKILTVLFCSFFLFGTVAVCSAITFTLESYTVSANSSDPGLVIQTSNSQLNPYSFDLNLGGSTMFNLFDIWTDENWVNRDDTFSKPISIAMNFSAPTPHYGGTSTGKTFGVSFFGFQWGKVKWNNPVDISFGPNLDGILRVSLSDETFNKGFLGLSDNGATVKGTFKYIAKASVPEPATLLLMGAGFLGLAVAGRRKFNRK